MSFFENWGARSEKTKQEKLENKTQYWIETLTSDTAGDAAHAARELFDIADKLTPEQKTIVLNKLDITENKMRRVQTETAGGDVHGLASKIGGSDYEAVANLRKKLAGEQTEIAKAA